MGHFWVSGNLAVTLFSFSVIRLCGLIINDQVKIAKNLRITSQSKRGEMAECWSPMLLCEGIF